MTRIPRPRGVVRLPEERTETRRRSRSASLLLVVLGVILSMVATTTPASAETEWYNVTQFNGGPGSENDAFIITTNKIAITGSYQRNAAGRITGVRCKYVFGSNTKTLYDETNGSNGVVRAIIDHQDPSVANDLLKMNLRDADKNVGGRAAFKGKLTTFYPGATSFSVCKDPNVNLPATAPSVLRSAGAQILGAAAALATWGVIAVMAAAKDVQYLANPAFEAAAGCVGGVVGALVYDTLLTGKRQSFGFYVGKCALTGATAAAAVTIGKLLTGNTSRLSSEVEEALRYAATETELNDIGSDTTDMSIYLRDEL